MLLLHTEDIIGLNDIAVTHGYMEPISMHIVNFRGSFLCKSQWVWGVLAHAPQVKGGRHPELPQIL